MKIIKVESCWSVGYQLSDQAIEIVSKYDNAAPVSAIKEDLELGAYYLIGISAPWDNNDILIEGMYQYKEVALRVKDDRVGHVYHIVPETQLDGNGFWNHKKGYLFAPLDRMFILKKFDKIFGERNE